MAETNQRRKTLLLWTVYKNPKDYPNKFVCRIWNFDKPTDKVYVADSLEQVRKHIPQGLINLGRNPEDDPCIIETWI